MFNMKEQAAKVRKLSKEMLEAMTDGEILCLDVPESPEASMIAGQIDRILEEASYAKEAGTLIY